MTPPPARPLDAAPGARTLYSDVGFLLAGEMLAEAAGAPLDAVHARLSEKLGVASHFHRLSTRGHDAHDPCAGRWDGLPPTGSVRPRPPAPGQESRWESLPTDPSRPGEVDDDNAWVMDGVSGHAGLFGTATEVARFGQRVLEELDGAGRLAPAALWERAVTPAPGSTRGLRLRHAVRRRPARPGVSSDGRLRAPSGTWATPGPASG